MTDEPTPPAVDRPGEPPDEDQVTADQLSIVRRLRQPRTIVSIVCPSSCWCCSAGPSRASSSRTCPATSRSRTSSCCWPAFVIFYLGFPLRGCAGPCSSAGPGSDSGSATRPRSSSCRGWSTASSRPSSATSIAPTCSRSTARSRSAGPSAPSSSSGSSTSSRSCVLGLAAGFWSFRDGLPPQVQVVFAIGVVVVVILAVGPAHVRNFGRRILARLPLPHRVVELYDRFEEGVFGAIGLRALPGLVVLTGAHLGDRGDCACTSSSWRSASRTSSSGISGAFFVALTGSLLTAVPLTPGRARGGRGRGRRRPDAGLRCAADRGARDHPGRPGDQRAVDHHPRQHRLRGLAEAAAAGASREVAHRSRLDRLRDPHRAPLRGAAPGPRRPQSVTGEPRSGSHRTAFDRTQPSLPRSGRRRRPVRTGDGGHRPSADSGRRDPGRAAPRQRSNQADHDDPERPSVQRMASGPAQGQEDVTASARPAVRRGSLDDLAADPGDRMPSLGTATKLARGLRELRDDADTPVPRALVLRGPRIRPRGSSTPSAPTSPGRAPGSPDHGVLPGRSDAPPRSDDGTRRRADPPAYRPRTSAVVALRQAPSA